MCRYGVEEEGGYVSICRYVSIWGGGRGRICVDMCRYGVEKEEGYVSICGVILDSRQGEELGESYVPSYRYPMYLFVAILAR
jgi:hypothetical protein